MYCVSLRISWNASYGTSEKCDYGWSGPPVLRIPNIVGGKIDLSDVKCAKESTKLDEKDALAIGDMLIVRTNGSRDLIGRSAIVERPFERPHFYASYLIRFRLVNVETLLAWTRTIWHAPSHRARIEALAATTAGQYNVNVAKLSRLLILLPPVSEMRRIATEVDRHLSVIDELEIEIEVNRKRADRLRQAILKRAFEGKLVDQDPDDEPASALLSRIADQYSLTSDAKAAEPRKEGVLLPMAQYDDRPRKTIVDVLKGAGAGMTPEALFAATGHKPDTVDDFYAELKMQLEAGGVEEHRSGKAITLRAKRQ